MSARLAPKKPPRMNTRILSIFTTLALSLSLSLPAAQSLLAPETAVREFSAHGTAGRVSVVQDGASNVLHVESPRTMPHHWDIQAAANLTAGGQAGDLVVISLTGRGKSAYGDGKVGLKFQDAATRGLLRQDFRIGPDWKNLRFTVTLDKDYGAGALNLTFFFGLDRQTVELKDIRVENHGAATAAALPPVPAVATAASTLPALKVPEGPKPIELPPLDPAVRAKKRYLMLKLDDVVAGNAKTGVHGGIRRIADYLEAEKIPAAFGVICASLEKDNPAYFEWLKSRAYQNGGLFEFWQHGWDHAMNVRYEGKTYEAEYGVPDYDYQKARFDKAQALFLEKTGVPLQAFNAPCGSTTKETLRLLEEHPEIKSCLFGPAAPGKFVFRRTFNLESWVGRVEFNHFINQYKNRRGDDYAVIQGHPAMWNETSQHEFRMILEQLKKDGWIFTTPTQYLAIREAEEAAKQPVFVPFTMGGEEPNQGAADVSALTPAPAGEKGRLAVDRDGHFVDAEGRRVRFLGTNITFGEAFPDHERAEQLARRLATMGINGVRIHHIDLNVAPWGIWKDKPWRDELDPGQLDKLDYFLAQLKKNGIYVDLNLHVSHRYWLGKDYSKDGLKDNSERTRLLPHYAKGLDRIEEDFIAQQKDYARMLLGHTNAYTGLTYAEDTGIGIVEINNEGSFHDLNPMTLPAYYRDRIQAKFNDWLRLKYGTSAALRGAWGSPVPLGEELFVNKPVCQEPKYIRIQADSPQAVRITLTEKPEQAYQAQVLWPGLTLEEGELYTLSFSARSEVPRDIPYQIRHQVADWHNCGLNGKMRAGKEWTDHKTTFIATNVKPGFTRLDLTLGSTPLGTFEIKNMSLRKGGDKGLLPDESLEAGTVRPVRYGTGFPGRAADWRAFAFYVEDCYDRQFKQLIREELGYKGLLFDTQCSYGGFPGLIREKGFDVIDLHSYWQHPSFPEQSWSRSVWFVNNRSMADNPDKGSNLGGLAVWRVAGMPLTVTEYDHPAPNSYVAEMFPMVATYAALQDWDGVFQFDWGQHGGGVNRISSFFDLQNHPAKLAFLPAAAVIYRAAAVAPLQTTAQLTLPGGNKTEPFAGANPGLKKLWEDAGLQREEYVSRRLSLRFDPVAERPSLARGGDAQSTSPLTWEKGSFRLDVPAAKAIVGAVTGKTHAFTDAAVTLDPSASGFAALTLTAMDLKPVRASGTLLLTVAGAVENTDMGWNENRTTVGTNWGKAPTLCEAVKGTATLCTDAKHATVYALDGKGKRKGEVPSTLKDGRLTFRMGPEAATLWYEIETE